MKKENVKENKNEKVKVEGNSTKEMITIGDYLTKYDKKDISKKLFALTLLVNLVVLLWFGITYLIIQGASNAEFKNPANYRKLMETVGNFYQLTSVLATLTTIIQVFLVYFVIKAENKREGSLIKSPYFISGIMLVVLEQAIGRLAFTALQNQTFVSASLYNAVYVILIGLTGFAALTTLGINGISDLRKKGNTIKEKLENAVKEVEKEIKEEKAKAEEKVEKDENEEVVKEEEVKEEKKPAKKSTSEKKTTAKSKGKTTAKTTKKAETGNTKKKNTTKKTEVKKTSTRGRKPKVEKTENTDNK